MNNFLLAFAPIPMICFFLGMSDPIFFIPAILIPIVVAISAKVFNFNLDPSPKTTISPTPPPTVKEKESLDDLLQRTYQEKSKLSEEEFKAYYSSDQWQRTRKFRLHLDNFTCQDCKAKLTNETATVHHLTYERFTQELMSDLKTVCYNCHCEYHPHLTKK